MQVRTEGMVNGEAVATRDCIVQVIVELVEAGDLGRFQALVGNERPLD